MKRSSFRLLALVSVVLVGLTFAGCGEGQKVGSEGLLDFEEQKGGGARLGERTAPPAQETPGSLTVDRTKPPPTPTAKPKETPAYFDVTLVSNSPYYKPGNRIVIRQGVTIRVTNDDRTAERTRGRSFTDKHGTFHSGLLKPGQSWTYTFNNVAKFEVIDEGLNFATAILEVVA